MTKRIIYIDDEIGEDNRNAQRYKNILQDSGDFDIYLNYPPKSFDEFNWSGFNAILIDFELTTPSPNDETVGYLGSTLAAELRMKLPNTPIILVTRRDVISKKRSFFEENVNFDWIIYKDWIAEKPEEVCRKIKSLIDGFEALTEGQAVFPNGIDDIKAMRSLQQDNWNALTNLMKAEEEDVDLLSEAAPPSWGSECNNSQTARWIIKTIMEYPGILYDDMTAATRLGISLESFLAPNLQEYISPARYDGIFSGYGQYWWRSKLFSLAYSLIYSNELKGTISEAFGKAYEVQFKEKLNPAICIVDKNPIAEWVCYILKQPVKLKNSIPYYPDHRPSVMDQARVSFKAVQESNEFDERLIDSSSKGILDELWE